VPITWTLATVAFGFAFFAQAHRTPCGRSGANSLHQEHNFASFYSAVLDEQFG
jgi:hypothetical protein